MTVERFPWKKILGQSLSSLILEYKMDRNKAA